MPSFSVRKGSQGASGVSVKFPSPLSSMSQIMNK